MKKIFLWVPALAYSALFAGACTDDDTVSASGRGGTGGISGVSGSTGGDSPLAGRGGQGTSGCGPVAAPEPGEVLIGCDGQPIGGRGGTGGSDLDAGDGGPEDAGPDPDAGDASALDGGQL